MTMKKKILTTLSVVLILGLAAFGILAYLQSEDSDVNVMTLGNVSIEQIEQERGENGLQDFTGNDGEDGKPLYPATPGYKDLGADELWKTENNAVDKLVSVRNKGESSAYVRTWFAFEKGNNFDLIDINKNADDWTWVELGEEEINDTKYVLMVATYDGELAPNSDSEKSLKQVALKSEATNEDVKAFGETYEILVYTQAIQTKGFANAEVALEAGFKEAIIENHPFNGLFTSIWNGQADTEWYDPNENEFIIKSAEELAGLAVLVDGENTFEGKTVKLGKNIDLNGKLFEPIGSYRFDNSFKGTFDGQGHTISNLSQNTWELNNGYYYNDCGLGLFGAVEEGTVKNLTIDGASISGESAICGAVAAVAQDATFENITVKDSEIADYQYYAGGIVGWASGETNFIGCNLDASTTVAAQWGDFNNANGGVVGGVSTNAEILMKDCTVACRIDSYNDVTSAYEWYSYRNSGMLIGNTGQKDDPDGDNVGNAIAPNLTCENVKVIYGVWANYTYCKFTNERYPWVRVQAGVSNSAYSNPRYGNPTDANGNKVVDDNHVHKEGEKHHELIVFDQLYGGPTGDRYCTYGTATHPGVTVVYNNK